MCDIPEHEDLTSGQALEHQFAVRGALRDVGGAGGVAVLPEACLKSVRDGGARHSVLPSIKTFLSLALGSLGGKSSSSDPSHPPLIHELALMI